MRSRQTPPHAISRTVSTSLRTIPMKEALALLAYNRGGQQTARDLELLVNEKNKECSICALNAERCKLDKTFQSESVYYVPRFFAAAIIGENPQAFRHEVVNHFRLAVLGRSSLAVAAHHTHAGAPVLVDVETIDFDVGSDCARQRVEGGMDSQRRRHQVDQRRLVTDLRSPKVSRGRCCRDGDGPRRVASNPLPASRVHALRKLSTRSLPAGHLVSAPADQLDERQARRRARCETAHAAAR